MLTAPVNLFRAEWVKITRNYILTSFLVWVFPVGLGAFYAVTLLLALAVTELREGMTTISVGSWADDAVGIWGIVNSFPGNVFGRMLPLAFMATVFASEYQWRTWKNLTPRSRRAGLLLVKFLALTVFISLSLISTSVVAVIGQSLTHRLGGIPYGPALSAEVLGAFVRDYGREALLGMVSLLIVAGFAALAALLTRSILGSLLVGFGFSIAEPMSLLLLLFLGQIIRRPNLVNLYRYTPSFNLDNVRSWLMDGVALPPVMPTFTGEFSLAASLALLAAWLVGLVLLSLWIFERQDIVA